MSENKPLSFQVPEPEIRPGGSPDFSGVEIPKAGVVRRPPIEADPEDIRDLAFTIIRVLSRSGDAAVSYTHLRAHETDSYLVCRLLLEKKQQ